MTGYLQTIAAAGGALIGLVDGGVSVQGTVIHGRFPLEIVLDCAALDVQVVFAVAVLAFPAPWRFLIPLAIATALVLPRLRPPTASPRGPT